MSVTVTLIRLPKSKIEKCKVSYEEFERCISYPHLYPYIGFGRGREIINYFYIRCNIDFPWGNEFGIFDGEHVINDNYVSCYENPICYFKEGEIRIIAKTLPNYFYHENIDSLWKEDEIEAYFGKPLFSLETVMEEMANLMDFFKDAGNNDECILTTWN